MQMAAERSMSANCWQLQWLVGLIIHKHGATHTQTNKQTRVSFNEMDHQLHTGFLFFHEQSHCTGRCFLT